MKKINFYPFSILFLLCLGLFFLNRYSTHDWGDDFALYLMQAKNTAHFHFQFPTHYVFNELNSIAAPSFYPPIFPAFLSLFYFIFKANIAYYIILMHLLLFANVLLFWLFLKPNYSYFIVLLLCLLLAYNPYLLYFKNEVMSEFLFIVFLLLFFIFYQKNKNSFSLIFLGALLLSTRSVGIVIIPTLLTLSFIKKEWKKNLFICTGIVVLSNVLNLIFTGQFNNSSYFLNFNWQGVFTIFLSNLKFYIKHISYWFIPFLETKPFLILPTQLITVSLLLLGFLSSLKQKKNLLELLFFFFYLLLILIYPYQGAGFRFLVPLVPILLLLFAEATLLLSKIISNKVFKKSVTFAPLLFLFLQYYPNIKYIEKSKSTPNGPYSKEALQTWEAIKATTHINDTIYFIYPKALAFFSNRYSKAFPETNFNKIRFFLDDASTSSNFVKQLKNSCKFDITWTNNRFTLFKKIE